MTTATVKETNKDKLESELERLEGLLREQLALARKGDITEVEVIANKAQGLVEKISQSGLLTEQLFRGQRERLHRLYDEICLVLSAQMKDVSQSLEHIHKGRKTVTLYRDNM